MYNLFYYIVILLYTPLILLAQGVLPDKPTTWVNDYANVLSSAEKNKLNTMLSGLEKRSSNQIFIALFNRLPENYYLDDFAVKLYDKWRPGLAEQDNGILIVIFIQDRKIRIEVGYGLEDVVTDAQAGNLIRSLIAPQFRAGNYYQGLRAALEALIPAVEGKYQLPLSSPQKKSERGITLTHIIIALIILIMISRIFRGPGSTGYGSKRGRTFFPGPIIFGGFGGGRSGGGFSGGGFSGGFGGMSGGGGASGSW